MQRNAMMLNAFFDAGTWVGWIGLALAIGATVYASLQWRLSREGRLSRNRPSRAAVVLAASAR